MLPEMYLQTKHRIHDYTLNCKKIFTSTNLCRFFRNVTIFYDVLNLRIIIPIFLINKLILYVSFTRRI